MAANIVEPQSLKPLFVKEERWHGVGRAIQWSEFGFESKNIEDGLGSHSHGHRLRSVVCKQLPLSAHHIHFQENRRRTQNTGQGAAVREGGW